MIPGSWRSMGRLIVATALILSLGTTQVLARGGGLRWGYHNPAQGYPLFNLWTFTSPWAALNGFAIPHHSLSAPGYLTNGSPHSRSGGYFGNGSRQFTPVDRSVAFPNSTVPVRYDYGVPFRTAAPVQSSSEYANAGPPDETGARFQPGYHYNYNGYWLHGYWGGGMWGWGRWGGALGVWSFPRWTLGPLYYVSGYGVYNNPFYVAGPAGTPEYLNYSYPVVDGSEEPEPPAPESDKSGTGTPVGASAGAGRGENWSELVRSPAVRAGLKSFDAGRDAFQKKDFAGALKHADDALSQLADDPAMHQFRALVLFAQGEYSQAAATLHSVLAVSPGWNWTTLSSFYPNQNDYTEQLRSLETYRKQHPQSADAAFLLAYHYVCCTHNDAGVRNLTAVTKLLPNDDLSAHLLRLISGAAQHGPAIADAQGAAAAQPPRSLASAKNAPPAIDQTSLIGHWKAKRSETVSIELIIGSAQQVTWTATHAGKATRLDGGHVVEGNYLVLAGEDWTLIGNVTGLDESGFHFKLLEDDPTDPGLEFKRVGPPKPAK